MCPYATARVYIIRPHGNLTRREETSLSPKKFSILTNDGMWQVSDKLVEHKLPEMQK